MMDAGDFFYSFGSIQRFRLLREMFHQTLVAVWVVYLSYLPLETLKNNAIQSTHHYNMKQIFDFSDLEY